jgi:hypothetical protein
LGLVEKALRIAVARSDVLGATKQSRFVVYLVAHRCAVGIRRTFLILTAER